MKYPTRGAAARREKVRMFGTVQMYSCGREGTCGGIAVGVEGGCVASERLELSKAGPLERVKR